MPRKELTNVTLELGPAWQESVKKMAEAVDRSIMGRVHRFLKGPGLRQTATFTVMTPTLDQCIPEKWAAEGLRVLLESSPIAGAVHRDFAKQVSNFSDKVNTHGTHKRRV